MSEEEELWKRADAMFKKADEAFKMAEDVWDKSPEGETVLKKKEGLTTRILRIFKSTKT